MSHVPALSCYKRGCERPECREEARRRWRREKARGPVKVDAAPWREHIERLVWAGEASLMMVSRAAGLSDTSVLRIMTGQTQGITPRVAQQLSAVTVDQLLADPSRNGATPALKSTRRLRAALALGWPIRSDCGQGHSHSEFIAGMVHPRPWDAYGTLEALEAGTLLEVDILMARRLRVLLARRIGLAGWGPCPELSTATRRKGYQVPAWYDGDWELPDAAEAGVTETARQEQTAREVAIVRASAAGGYDDRQIAEQNGWSRDKVYRIRKRHGIPAGGRAAA